MRYVFGECTLDTEPYMLSRAHRFLALQPKVFQVLHYLLIHRNRVIAKAELREQVWPQQCISEATLARVIRAVRQAVGDDSRRQWCIQTCRGQGYRFVASLAEPAARDEDATAPAEALGPTAPTLPTLIQTVPSTSRRQLTVLFCDVMEATRLAAQLDPEDLREIMLAAYAACTEVAQRFEGATVQYLGEGLLIFFGYPQTHEDEAQRAIHTALDIREAITTLNTRLHHEYGVHMTIRLGIHTGMVVVEQGEDSGRPPLMVFGDTPHIASRLQTLAGAHQVLISEHTWRLAGGGFDYEELGVHTLRGVATPVRVYAVRGTRSVVSRFDAATVRGLSALVGREEELRLFLRRWQQAQDGEGQVVLLAGEAGMGKSRLARAVWEALAMEPHTYVSYQCVSHYRHSAFYPLRMQLADAAGLAQHDSAEQKLDKLERFLARTHADVADVAPLFAAMLSLPIGKRYPPVSLAPGQQRAKTIEALVGQIARLAEHQAVLCIVEDVQWSDPTTLEVLDVLVHRVHTMRALVIITHRPEFVAPWRMAMDVTALTLTRLDRTQSTLLIEQVTAGKALPEAVVNQIVAQADGLPLFVEELTKTVVESKWLAEGIDGYVLLGPLPLLAIPSTLQDTLTARLDRLGPAKAVAQLAATIGREFSATLLQAVLPVDEDVLQSALTRLVEAEIIYPHGMHPDATYVFKHALIQGAAYYSLLRQTRQGYHRQIAQVLAEQFAETVETQPELLAYHYTEAGAQREAVVYWQRAGQRALQRSAHTEAIAHLTKGLAVLQELPEDSKRLHDELRLHISLGPALMATKGYAAPEVQTVYAQAQALCQQCPDSPDLFPVLFGVWGFHLVRAEYSRAYTLAHQLLHAARRGQDAGLLVEAHGALGVTAFYMGDLLASRAYLVQSGDAYDATRHREHETLYSQNPWVASRAWEAQILWLLGYPEQALRVGREALAYAEALAHPFSTALALFSLAMVHQFRRESTACHAQATRQIQLSDAQGFPFWTGLGMILIGWAAGYHGQIEEGLQRLYDGLVGHQTRGVERPRPYFVALLADLWGRLGHVQDGLAKLTEMLEVVATTGERWCEAELYRLQGVLLHMQRQDQHHVETCFQQALAIARQQHAKSLELRAAMDLCRLWQGQGRDKEARVLLAPLYAWFTEGFDTADLQEAKALLAELDR